MTPVTLPSFPDRTGRSAVRCAFRPVVGDLTFLVVTASVAAVLMAFPGSVYAQSPGATRAGSRGDAAGELLARRVAALRSQVQSLDAQINQLLQRMPPVEAEIDRLTQEIGSLQAPEPMEEKKEEKKPKDGRPTEVQYRPPMLRVVKKDTPLAIVCQNKRVLILDLDEQNAAFNKIADDEAALQRFVDAGGGTLSAGDYEIKVTITRFQGGALISQEAVPRSGHTGESLETTLQKTSRLQQRVGPLDAEKNAIQFAVYPDSFDVFRGVRKTMWERGFSVNWIPLEHGEAITIGGGPITAQ